MEQTILGYKLPRSPFGAELRRIRLGSLAEPVAYKRPRRITAPRLSDAERSAIGATGGPVQLVANRYGVGYDYVRYLRKRYRRGEL